MAASLLPLSSQIPLKIQTPACGWYKQHHDGRFESIRLAALHRRDDATPGRFHAQKVGGDEGTRTPDPRDANAVLSQLSYIPTRTKV